MKGSPCNIFFLPGRILFLQAQDPTRSEFLLAHSVAQMFKTIIRRNRGSTSVVMKVMKSSSRKAQQQMGRK